MRLGQDIFRDAYVYPPFQALLAAPFSCVPMGLARGAWALLNALAAAVFVLSSWRLSGGEMQWKNERVPRTETLIFALGFAGRLGSCSMRSPMVKPISSWRP